VFAESTAGALFPARERDSIFLIEHLAPADYRVYLNDDFEHAELVRLARADEVVNVRLKATPPEWIRGQVVDEDDIAVSDAWVTHFRSDSPMQAASAVAVLTDEAGAFQLPVVPSVPYSIQVASPVCSENGYPCVSTSIGDRTGLAAHRKRAPCRASRRLLAPLRDRSRHVFQTRLAESSMTCADSVRDASRDVLHCARLQR
jgi:hypothetical protein